MKLDTENKELLFARDVAVSAFNRAKVAYQADLRIQGDPAQKAIPLDKLRADFDAMTAAADLASAAEEALKAYSDAHQPPAEEKPAESKPNLEVVPPPASA